MEVFDGVDNPSNTPNNCGMSLISTVPKINALSLMTCIPLCL